MSSVKTEMIRLHAHVCKGLADPERLMIIDALRDGEVTVTDLVDALEIPQANVSQHLAVLRDKGLVESRRDGQWAYYTLTSPKIVQAVDLLRVDGTVLGHASELPIDGDDGSLPEDVLGCIVHRCEPELRAVAVEHAL